MLTVVAAMPSAALAFVVNPDFMAPGVIAGLKSDAALKPDAKVFYSSRPYSETYNLGATGLRGWIYIDVDHVVDSGFITGKSRQILVTVAEAPASAVIAVDDVILGAMAADSGEVPKFTSDCRKALGVAIGNAEKTGAGTLRVKRWRAGDISDVNIPMTIMGEYTATAPFNCSKSDRVLANARTKLVNQLKADSNFLGNSYGGAIRGLALLASVAPGDPDYATVQTRLQSYARSIAAASLQPWGQEWWSWSYMSIFLSEYYLRTVADGAPDASVLAGISKYTVVMAKGQSRYGTFSHGGSPVKLDGSLHGTVTPYGPVNAVGIPTNIAIVMGKKALVTGGYAIDAEIDPAIQRGSDFFSYYVNKGSIPYGEHEPLSGGHASNGKDAMCAVLFGLQENRTVESEFFARMSVAGCTGREYGHTGQGLSYLWGCMGANMGGPTAVAKYMEKNRWHLDLVRRTDGSFAYEGKEAYGGGSTADGSYLGASGYRDVSPTASYILSYGVSLNRLFITGRDLSPAHILSADKVAKAIAAATYTLDCPAFLTSQLLADLSAYDPVVRSSAAAQLATRPLTTTELNNLIASITNGTMSSDPSARMGACQALGARKATGALVALGQRLSDSDLWVRGKAAQALRCYNPADSSTLRDTMLTAYVANATDPEVIVWDDPVQIANNFLCFALFGDAVYGKDWTHIAPYTIKAAKNLLYPAVKAGLRQPDSNSRLGAIEFAKNYLTQADVQVLTPNLFAVATTEALADTMWHGEARATGINALAKFKSAEAIPIALSMMEIPRGYGWGAQHFQIAALNVLNSFGDAARWTLPTLRQCALTWNTTSDQYPVLNATIASIEAATTSPTGVINLVAVGNPQVVTTPVGTAKVITLTGSSIRGPVNFTNVTRPLHGELTGPATNLTYTPTTGYSGPDFFTFQVEDGLTTSAPVTVSIIVGTAGTGLKGEYYDNLNFTNLKLTRFDPQINFDWGTSSPVPATMGVDTFSARWSGLLLVPETGNYTFSTFNSDGVRLFINGALVINDYVDQTTNWKDSAPISLTAGQMVEIQMEYYENTGSAVAKLKWRGPSMAGLNGSIISQEWLYDGTNVTSRTPYAHAQSVSLNQNAPQAITLTGSGVGQTPLDYSLVTRPLHGTLTGEPPNLLYSPASDFGGKDSFSFLVNNGASNSAPATVSIGVWNGTQRSYFWTNAVSGNWSGPFWSNASGAAATPPATGDSACSLNFNRSGTYTTTQDLNANYVFNQLNFGGEITLDGANKLSPTANGPFLPKINQNSASAVMISAPVSLRAMTAFVGEGGGSVQMSGVVSGTGGVIKDCPGTLQIYGVNPNTYSGGTIVSGGTLHLGAYIDNFSPHCVNPAGTGPVTLNSGGTIQFDNVNANNALTVNGGGFNSRNGHGATWSGAITLNGNLTINAASGTMKCTGVISGAGGFTKVGDYPLVLSRSNSFSGQQKVVTGTVTCSNVAALGTGPLDITLGAMVALDYTGTRVIAALTFNGGAPLAPGTYGSATSNATNKNGGYFSGSGMIEILPASTTGLSLTAGTTPSEPGTPLTFTATVTGSAPTGNVAFYDGTTVIGTSALNGAFQASITTSNLARGAHLITAKYAGNAANSASSSAALAIEVASVLPATPLNLFGERAMTSVGLTWTLTSGATSYHVKRSLTNDGPYTTIGTSVVANYNDLTAPVGACYYMVSASNDSGESANSASVTVKPLAPSSAKDILTFGFSGQPKATFSGTTISVTLPFGANITALAPTYTVSLWATGFPTTGIARNFTTPQAFTITADDGSTKIYTVTVTVLPEPVLPVTSGLVLRMDASKITGTTDGAQLDTWVDTSGAANNAVRQSGSSAGYPKYVASAVNDKPVVRFNSGNATGDYFKFTRISNIQTVFWVLKENAGLSDGRFLLGDDTTSQFHRKSANGSIWDSAYTDSKIQNGSTKLMGEVINGTSTSLPSGSFQLVSLVTTGNVQANQICQDREGSHGSWQGDIAEILIYNRALTGPEERQVGSYLSTKYALPTAYLVPIGSDATTTSLTSSLGATAEYGPAVTFTAGVTGGSATGTVTFKDGLTVLGFGTLSSGTATFTTSALAMGAHSITATYRGDSTFATSISPAFAYSVTAKPLTIAGVTAGNKVYDATTAASLAGGTLSGVVNGDIVTITAGSGNFASANVGLRAITATGFTLGGANASNYSLSAQPLVPSATITARALSVTASNQSKVFGQTRAFGSGSTLFTSSGLVAGETIGSVTLACTGGVSTAPVASYPITPNMATGGTFAASNYAMTYGTGALTVSKADQTITFGVLGNRALGDAAFSLTATASSGLAASYVSSDPTVASVTGRTVTVLKTGITIITASQAGDGNFKAAPPVTQSLMVLNRGVITWVSAVAGNWSDSTKWTVGALATLGQASYALNFDKTGTYTATQNLSEGFQLNQMIFAGSDVTLAGNRLAMTANGLILPILTQYSSVAVTISAPVSLTADTTLNGSGAGELTLSGIISGGGSLTKTTSGNLTLSGVNTYTAGTSVNNGTLTLANKNGLGTGPLTLAAGTTFQQSAFDGNGSDGALPNAFVLNGNVTMNMPFGWKDVWLSQPVSGTGGFTIQGGGRSLTLTGNNTFTGGIILKNDSNRIQISHVNALGTGTFRTERTTTNSGQLVSLANLSAGAGVTNAIDIASGAYLNVSADGTNHLRLSGAITSAVGTGNLYKSGSATLTLTGTNTYTGTTTVAGGTLECTSAIALGQGPVVITSGAKLTLNLTGTRQVASLSLGGVAQANGSYGSTASAATNKNDTYFSGTGTVTVGRAATSTTLTSSLGSTAPYGSAVTFTATVAVTGGPATGTVTFKDGVTVLGTGTLSSGRAIFATSTLAIGAHSITASYEGSVTFATSVSSVFGYSVTAAPGYETWAANGAQSLTRGVNDSPMADPDGDGISNLMEFALGGAPMVSSAAILPTFTNPGAAWVFEYNRSDAAQSTTTQVVEYGNNLSGWTPVTIPASSAVMVEITPGSPSDRVKVTIPNQGNQIFVRLKVSQ